jgi:hypothetical protein
VFTSGLSQSREILHVSSLPYKFPCHPRQQRERHAVHTSANEGAFYDTRYIHSITETIASRTIDLSHSHLFGRTRLTTVGPEIPKWVDYGETPTRSVRLHLDLGMIPLSRRSLLHGLVRVRTLPFWSRHCGMTGPLHILVTPLRVCSGRFHLDPSWFLRWNRMTCIQPSYRVRTWKVGI